MDWIGASSLSQRLRVTVETFALGATFQGSLPRSVLLVCGLCAILMAAAIGVALVLLIRRATESERRAAQIAGLIAAIGVGLSLIGALVYKDYFLHKNLIPVVPQVAIVLAAGLGCRKAGRLAAGATAVVVAAGIALTVLSFAALSMRRPDVRQVSERLGMPVRPRIVIFVPRWQLLLEHYQHGVENLPAGGRRVTEIDVFTSSAQLPARTVPDGFRLVRLQHGDTFTLFRFRSAVPVLVTPGSLGHQVFSESGLEPVAVFQASR